MRTTRLRKLQARAYAKGDVTGGWDKAYRLNFRGHRFKGDGGVTLSQLRRAL
jgi:hypothetical protein